MSLWWRFAAGPGRRHDQTVLLNGEIGNVGFENAACRIVFATGRANGFAIL